MDRLIAAIEGTNNPSVVGLDPTLSLLPDVLLEAVRAHSVLDRPAALAFQYYRFNKAIIDAIADIVPAVKPQIAMYEALGPEGIRAYTQTTQYAHDRGLYVIGDIKRGDIGSTAGAYATHLTGLEQLDDEDWDDTDSEIADIWHEDAVTVNPYLGSDGVMPFVDAAHNNDKDVFVLLRTSNPSSDELQTVHVCDNQNQTNSHNADNSVKNSYQTVSDVVGQLIEKWGMGNGDDAHTEANAHSAFGYSRVGAVVGATHPREAQKLRSQLPHTFFLVPGFGAQGGTAADCAALFDKNGRGAIVNSSRGIIGAWKKSDDVSSWIGEEQALDGVARAARAAALSMRDSLTQAIDEHLSDSKGK